jgi:hypothetical protein
LRAQACNPLRSSGANAATNSTTAMAVAHGVVVLLELRDDQRRRDLETIGMLPAMKTGPALAERPRGEREAGQRRHGSEDHA